VNLKIDQKDISILQSLCQGGLTPSLQKISKITSLNKQLVYSRLQKLLSNNIITNFEPKINLTRLGLNFSTISLLELDMHKIKKDETIETFSKISKLDSTVSMTPLIPNTNYQLLIHEIFEKREDYYNHLLKLYEDHPTLGEIVKERRIFTVNPEETSIIKEQNYSNAINLLTRKLGRSPYFII
jgi:DNA-binding Lrp family transcriptional regulator